MMTTQESKNYAIAQAYERYKLERAQRLAEEKASADLKAEIAAAWAKKKKNTVVVTRKDHMCDGCGSVIAAGSRCMAPSELVNVYSRG